MNCTVLVKNLLSFNKTREIVENVDEHSFGWISRSSCQIDEHEDEHF